MVLLCGRTARFLVLAPLLIALLGASAAAPVSAEKSYRAARAAADLDELPKAEQIARTALAQPGLRDAEWVWALRVLLAEIAAKRRRPEEIRKLELPPKYATSEAAVFRLLALGIADYPDPTTRFEEARQLATKHQPQLLVYVHLAMINVGGKEAEDHARTAVRLAKKNRLAEANALNALSRIYTRQKRFSEAVDAGQKAIDTYTSLGATGRISTAGGNLGWAYLEVGNWEVAAELFARAEAAAARIGNNDLRVLWIHQLANVHRAEERFDDAARYHQQALALARKEARAKLPIVLIGLARHGVETGNFAAARRSIDEAISLEPGQEDMLTARVVDARIAAMTGDHARAEKTFREVIAAAKEWPIIRWSAESELALLYARMQRNDLAERAFRSAIGSSRTAKEKITNPELSISYFNTAREVFDGYVNFLMRLGRVEDALKATDLIRAEQSERASSEQVDPRAFAKQTGATILCYWLGRDGSYAWRVTPNEVAHAVLPAEKAIARDVETYRKVLDTSRGTLAASGARGRQLYQMLVAPIAPPLRKNARVIVVADGILHALNFETLVPPSPPMRYWIEDVVLSSAGSLQPPAPRKPAADASLLLVGDPAPAAKEFPKLQHAAREMQTVASHFGRRIVLQGAKATPAAYKRAAPQRFEFVHFAAHGVATRKRPLDSAVILSRDPSNGYRLLARDILAQPLQARLVTISSCHGAGERTFAGEGLVGLAWAFLGAGADHVIAALTEVDDSVAPELMNRMYASIRKGNDPAVALRNAKLSFVQGKGAYRMPQYWAPFVLYSGP